MYAIIFACFPILNKIALLVTCCKLVMIYSHFLFPREALSVLVLPVALYSALFMFICLFISIGMNTEDFKYKWGGEDWDLLDRVINAKLEVERIRHPGLYHHYHTKQKVWS